VRRPDLQRSASYACGVLVLVGTWYAGTRTSPEPAKIVFEKTPPNATTPVPPSGARLVVDVAGAVQRPGVYELAPGSRVRDAIQAAGGAKADADFSEINRAAPLVDGTQLSVPHRETTVSAASSSSSSRTRRRPSRQIGGRLPAYAPKPVYAIEPVAPSEVPASAPKAEPRARRTGKKEVAAVNVNAADEAELTRLPGVGPSTAAKIVAYRDANGPFGSVEDLLNVSGIGPKKLEAMRPYVRL
jgi:competence protein ComEA